MNQTTFSALAETNRYNIVELLRDKPRPVGELAYTLHVRQPQISKHLKVLANAGIVEVHPHANQRIYALSPKKFQEIDDWLEQYRAMWEERFDNLDLLLQKKRKKGGE